VIRIYLRALTTVCTTAFWRGDLPETEKDCNIQKCLQ